MSNTKPTIQRIIVCEFCTDWSVSRSGAEVDEANRLYVAHLSTHY